VENSLNEDLGDIVRRAQKKDENAFQTLYTLLVDRLFMYALSHTKDRERALDITQETFIDLWSALPRFEYRTKEECIGFVFSILKRKVMRSYSRQTKETVLLKKLENEDDDTVLEHHEDHRHLLKKVDELDECHKDIITLRYWSSLSFKEIGVILGIEENTAKVTHHRALKKLEALITPTFIHGK